MLSRLIYRLTLSILTWSSTAHSLPHPTVAEPPAVIVAVIDTGVDISHPFLKDQIWMNHGEMGTDSRGRDKRYNGIDDDGNGFVDDFAGWNFAKGNNDVIDKHGHGTHIAGIITGNSKALRPDCQPSLRQPAQQLAPACRPIQIMPLKFYEPGDRNPSSVTSTIKAIQYAVKMGARVINYSAGGFTRDVREEEALQDARRRGIILVAAAGNEASNSDLLKYYPADYELPNIISVAAVDAQKRLLKSSNYGVRTVDVAAPGKDVWSTLPGGAFGTMSGTSQATAFVSAAAAVVAAEESPRSAESLVSKVILRGKYRSELSERTRLGILIQPERALILAKDWLLLFPRS